MIEEGLYQLLSANAGVTAAAANTARPDDNGIYLGRLPINPNYPALTFKLVSSPPDPTLTDPNAIIKSRWQFDCVAMTAEESVTLGRAVISCLNGFSGNLPDGTRVISSIKDNALDTFYSDANTSDRMVDFVIMYTPGVNQS